MKTVLNIFLLIFPFFVFANKAEMDSLGAVSGIVLTMEGQPSCLCNCADKK